MVAKKPKMDLVQQVIEKVNAGGIELTLWYFRAPGMDGQIGIRGRIPDEELNVGCYVMREKEGMLYWEERLSESKVDIHLTADVLGIHDLRRKKAYYTNVSDMMPKLLYPTIRYSYENRRGQHDIIRAKIEVKDGGDIRNMSVDVVARVLEKEMVLPMKRFLADYSQP